MPNCCTLNESTLDAFEALRQSVQAEMRRDYVGSVMYVRTFAMLVLDAIDVESEHNFGLAVPRETYRLGHEGRIHGITESTAPASAEMGKRATADQAAEPRVRRNLRHETKFSAQFAFRWFVVWCVVVCLCWGGSECDSVPKDLCA